jgi:hypothetical protein
LIEQNWDEKKRQSITNSGELDLALIGQKKIAGTAKLSHNYTEAFLLFQNQKLNSSALLRVR